MIRTALAAGLLLGLAACAAQRWTYVAPPGVSAAKLAADRDGCVAESELMRGRDEQERLEQQCMMVLGYTVKQTPP